MATLKILLSRSESRKQRSDTGLEAMYGKGRMEKGKRKMEVEIKGADVFLNLNLNLNLYFYILYFAPSTSLYYVNRITRERLLFYLLSFIFCLLD